MEKKSLRETLASKILYDTLSGKERERRILVGFLTRLQLNLGEINSNEKPDFFFSLASSSGNLDVACEITEYFSDAGAHGSLQARFIRQWRRFAIALRARLNEEAFSANHLARMYGAIHFKSPDFNILDRCERTAFISEIVLAAKERRDFSILSGFDSNVFPLLEKHVSHIYLKDAAAESDILWWPAHLQSGSVKDPCETLIEIAKEKNESAQAYEWKGATERWLLIYGAADGVADTIGPYSDPGIRKVLGDLLFSRVYVWNKFFERIDEIYPSFVKVFDAREMTLHRRDYPPAIRQFVVGRT